MIKIEGREKNGKHSFTGIHHSIRTDRNDRWSGRGHAHQQYALPVDHSCGSSSLQARQEAHWKGWLIQATKVALIAMLALVFTGASFAVPAQAAVVQVTTEGAGSSGSFGDEEETSTCSWDLLDFVGTMKACFIPGDPTKQIETLKGKMQSKIPFGMVTWIKEPIDALIELGQDADRMGDTFPIYFKVLGKDFELDLFNPTNRVTGSSFFLPGMVRPWLTPLLIIAIWGTLIMGVLRKSSGLFK